MYYTTKEIKDWLGSDQFTTAELSKILCQLLNDEYNIETVKTDIEFTLELPAK